MKNLLSALLTSTILLFSASMFAQNHGGKGNPGAREIRQYFNQKIKPELIKQQAKFISVLTDDEISELEKIKKQWQGVKKQMHGKVKPENRENTQKAHFTAISSQVKKIIDAHPKERDEYVKTMTVKKVQWEKDIKTIREKHNMTEWKRGSKLLSKVNDPTFILMYNPNRKHNMPGNKKHPMKPGSARKLQKGARAKMLNEPTVIVRPYPVKTTATVKVTGAKNKNVKVTVFDSKGKEIRNLYDGPSSLALLNFSVDVSKWQPGMYTVKVKLDDRGLSSDLKVIR